LSVRWHPYPDAKAAAEACAHHIVANLEEALTGQEYATIALSGGTSPRLLFERLAASPFPWAKVHFFWVDERAVPPTSSDSNYRMAAEALLIPAHIPQANIHRIHAELMPEAAARTYSEEIRQFFGLDRGEMPRFDLIHRGVGPDAHTASLFPGEPSIEDRQGLAAAVFVEKLGQWRITMLPGVLLAARQTVMLVAGADKAEPVRAIFHEPLDPKRYPGQLVTRQGHPVEWFLDQAAARLIESE
jgi:6-phosphogluconolactonase